MHRHEPLISDYGVIGNGKSAALVSRGGWNFCFPLAKFMTKVEPTFRRGCQVPGHALLTQFKDWQVGASMAGAMVSSQ